MPRVAKRDKIVYKVFHKSVHQPGLLQTPYQNMVVDRNDIMIADKMMVTKTTYKYKTADFQVNYGIHSWATKEKAGNSADNKVVLMAVIPAGTPYYTGVNGDIVSEVLILDYEPKKKAETLKEG